MNRLIAVLASVMDVSESTLNLKTTCDDVESWDSLAIINLAIALEGEFGVSLSAMDVETLVSVKNIVIVLNRHGVKLAA
jgi:acyl carrier protein